MTRVLPRLGLGFAGLFAVAFPVLPVLWLLWASLKTNAEIFAFPPDLFAGFSMSAYAAVLSDPVSMRYLLNSYIVALTVTAATLLVASITGYALSRFDFALGRILDVTIVGVQAIPPITLLIPFFGLMVAINLVDSLLALIVTYIVFTLPYAVIMMHSYFNSISKELDESARIDGAGPVRVLVSILMPIALPRYMTVGIYTFMIAWNEYLFALTLTSSDEVRTIPVGILLLMGQNSFHWNEIMALSLVSSLPALVMFLFFQRYFIGGLSSGAVKG